MAISQQSLGTENSGKVKRFGAPQIAGFVFQVFMTTLIFAFARAEAGELVAVWWGMLAGALTFLAFGFEQAFGSGEDEGYLTWATALGGVGIGIPIVLAIFAMALFRFVTSLDVSVGPEESKDLMFWGLASGGSGAAFVIGSVRRIYPWNYFLTLLVGILGSAIGFGIGKAISGF